MDKKKGIIRDVNLFMGLILSLFLSLTGNLMSGHFEFVHLIISFVGSFLISMIIGITVPMKPLTDKVIEKCDMKPNSLTAHLLESLISDLIYTPVITFAMVTMAYRFAISNIPEGETPPNYLMMLGSSMAVSLIVGYVLIFIFRPICIKLAFRKNGIKNEKQLEEMMRKANMPEGANEGERPE